MLEMDVSIKFSCRDKELRNKLRDIFDLSCGPHSKDYLGLGKLDNNTRWAEFYARIENMVPLDHQYSLVDSYITTIKSMHCDNDGIELYYETGVYGKEFAEEMTMLLRNMGAEEVKATIIDNTSHTSSNFISPAVNGC